MPSLPPEIILQVAEQCDSYDTIDSFIRVFPQTKRLLNSNEKSVVKSWIERNVRENRLIFPPELGIILDTAGASIMNRRVLPSSSFKTMRELDTRRRRIDLLFEKGGLFWRITRASADFGDLSNEQMVILMQGFKRACMLIDRVVDCAAEVTYCEQSKGEDTGTGEEEDQDDGDPRPAKKRKGRSAGRTVLNTERKAHWAMRRYIQSWLTSSSVSRLDLAYLYWLVEFVLLGKLGLVRSWLGESIDGSDTPDMEFEERLALREIFMRHGSAVLWIRLRPWYERWYKRSGRSLFAVTTVGAGQVVDRAGEGEGEAQETETGEGGNDGVIMSSSSTTGALPQLVGHDHLSGPTQSGASISVDAGVTGPDIESRLPVVSQEHPRSLSTWLSETFDQLLDEMQDFETGGAALFENEEDDDGTGVLPGLTSALSQVVMETFLSHERDRKEKEQQEHHPSTSSEDDQEDDDDDDDDELNGYRHDHARLRADHLRKVLLVKLLADVGYFTF